MPARRDQVLFLDFDGVLHPDAVYLSRQGPTLRAEGELFMWAPILVEILENFQEVSLVLSTSWVRNLSFKRALGFLPSALGNRVTGATWHSSMAREWTDESKWDGRTRYDQISRYAARAQVAHWVSLDDDPEGCSTT
ncbi:HAD domain-containing protein, partial [Pseudomonas viridiflava]|uniref:HAD domain-containing protein n=1 Tax=Pseudomonas viridiflava TaxID=33069 RepID=UPI000F01D27C